MKLIFSAFLFLFVHFSATAQLYEEGMFKRHYNDSNFVKNRGIYVTFAPVSVGSSINTDTEAQFSNVSVRTGIHWMTKNYQKFQFFGSFGNAYKWNHQELITLEIGVMMGKIIHSRKRGFLDLSIGAAYTSRKPITSYYNNENVTEEQVREVHTAGIPFEAMAYTSKFPVGIGIGIAGNINANQPNVNLVIQMRLGNPILKKHTILNRYKRSNSRTYLN